MRASCALEDRLTEELSHTLDQMDHSLLLSTVFGIYACSVVYLDLCTGVNLDLGSN